MSSETLLNDVTIERYKGSVPNPDWDNFVSQLPDVSYLQTSAWSMVNDNDPHQQSYTRVVIKEGGGVVAGFQLTIRRYPKVGNIGFIIQGPCLRHPEPKYYDLIAASMKKLLKSENLLYLAICLNYAYTGLAEHLESRKFFKAFPGMQPIINTKATVLLDLTLSENELFEQLDAGRRRNVRKGEKFKFDTRLGTREDISTFYSLMLHTCNQRGVEPLIENVDYFYSVWDLFHAKGWVTLHMAEVENRCICSTFCYHLGDTYRSQHWGWTREFSKERIAESFIWKDILLAKNMGYKKYDCVQVNPVIAEKILSGAELSDQLKSLQDYGVTDFKVKWGGKLVKYPGKYVIFRNKFVKCGCYFLFNTNFCMKLVKRIKMMTVMGKIVGRHLLHQ